MTKKNYIQTIKSFNPSRLFTFSNINSFITYNGVDVSGAIFDEDTNALMSPKFTYIKNAPKTIKLFGPSVVTNERNNQSLSLSGNSSDEPYNISYESLPQQQYTNAKSSFSFQFNIPRQGTSTVTSIDDHTTPIATITTNNGDVYSIKSKLYGDYWYLPIKTEIDLSVVTSISVSMSYKNVVFSVTNYKIEQSEFFDRFSTFNQRYELPSVELRPVFESRLPELPNMVQGDKASTIYAYSEFGNSMIFPVIELDGSLVMYGGGTSLVIYGQIHENIVVNSHTQIKSDSSSTLAKIGDVAIFAYTGSDSLFLQFKYNSVGHVNDLLGYSQSSTHKIDYDVNHTVVLTHETINSKKVIKLYYNSKLLRTFNDIISNGFSNSILTIGSDAYIQTLAATNAPFSFWGDLELVYMNNALTTFIDNVVVFNNLLSARDIYLMYIRTMTYTELLSSFNPKFHVKLDEPRFSFVNEVGRGKFNSYNFKVKPVSIDSEVYDRAVNFSGYGSLLYDDTSSTFIDYSRPFSIVMWIKTTTRDFLLFSERNKSNKKSGLSIFIDDGKVLYKHDSTRHVTECFIADGKYRMLCVSYDGKKITTFSPDYHTSTHNVVLSNSGIYPRYTTLLNDKGADVFVDVTLSALTVFTTPLDVQQFTDLYNENVTFSKNGKILFENLPVLSEVRIIEHSSGKLLDIKYTDVDGRFKYTSIYNTDIDIITKNNGRLQVIGTL